MILHIDCNSFYASCEQAFRPDIAGRPVVVLSNNDGIVVALSREAKAVGIKRGDALFQIRGLIAAHSVTVCSSNYTLYADMSRRIHNILAELCPEVEPYSIDEFFAFFPEIRQIGDMAREIKDTIEESTGIPVSVGVGPSKTLAKLANKLAKKRNGVLDARDLDLDAELRDYPVQDIWGIGGRYASFLISKGVRTALDLKNYPPHLARKHLTIRGLYTVRELNGIPSIDRIVPKPRKNIISSRGFSRLVEDLADLEEAAADYTLEAARKARAQGSAASAIGVAVMTNRFRTDLPQYCDSVLFDLSPPSSFLPDLVKKALEGVRKLYKSGYKYQKVMVYLLDLIPDADPQGDFFLPDRAREAALMKCFDEISGKYDGHTLFLGARGTDRPWSMKRDHLSPAYTTRLDDIPKVR